MISTVINKGGGMKQVLTIYGVMPGLNEIIGTARHNRYASAIQKSNWTDVVLGSTLVSQIKPVERAFFTFRWYEKHKRRDPDNIVAGQKFIFDGLVKAGVLKNDGWAQVTGFEHFFFVDKKNPRVEVIIDEMPSD